ncbi:hypothetical protein N0V94_006971 [Neodidymelliopsis sp. IMI 364377]|nr:hypothetical protein N0V94_006971 [Neodidymelliopsis sp. IMI 364377]
MSGGFGSNRPDTSSSPRPRTTLADLLKSVASPSTALMKDDLRTSRKALNRDLTEAKERLVNLPEDDPSIFKIYVHLLYTNRIAVVSDVSQFPDKSQGRERIELAKLYVLAEKLQDPGTKDKALAALMATCLSSPTQLKNILSEPDLVWVVYNGTFAGSTARKMIVVLYTQMANGNPFRAKGEKFQAGWPTDFTLELLASALDKPIVPTGPWATGDVTPYMEVPGSLRI